MHDGYYREAVASFASALERLYERFVDVVCRAGGINRDGFANARKPLRKASERQLGAFIILYLLETMIAFSLLTEKNVSFRNKVIHDGLIPDRKQAVAYGQAAGDCAAPIIRLLQSVCYQQAQQALMFDSLSDKARRATMVGARHGTLSIATPFDFNNFVPEFDLEGMLAMRAKRRKV